MEIYLSLLLAVIGMLLYALAASPKNQELGRLMFFAGLLAFLIGAASGRLVGVIPK